jgi:hypothetical protein
MSDEYRKIHVTLSEENYQLIRKLAFDAEATKSDVINFLIEEKSGKLGEAAVPAESTGPLEEPSPSAPATWSVTTMRNR